MSHSSSRNVRVSQIDERSHILQELLEIEEMQIAEMEEEMELSWPDDPWWFEDSSRDFEEEARQEELAELQARGLLFVDEPLSCYGEGDYYDW